MRCGATRAMASAAAAALAAAEMEGISSHGASRIPQYCSHLRNGRALGAAGPVVARDSKAACLVDCGPGTRLPGVRARGARGHRALQAIRRFIRGDHQQQHFGVAAYHVEAIAGVGQVGFAFSNSPAAMPAWGGKRALFGTTPIAATFPRRTQPPLVIDLSLSAAARGRIMVAAREGKPIPQGWALDRDRKADDRCERRARRQHAARGSVKGAMLALTVELLVCALSGAAFGFESDSFFTEEGGPTRIGQAFLAIDPGALAGQEVFYDRVETLVAAMIEDPAVRLPGERRLQNRERAAAQGSKFPRGSSREFASLPERASMPDTHAVDVYQACVRTPFATLGIQTTATHVTGIRFLVPSTPALMPRRNSIAHLACAQIQAYLENARFEFDLPLAITGTRHRIAVWEAMQRIPAGKTSSYGEIASAIGSSARAVGGACGANPFPS
jgi:(2R)-3-sulfolactate dehydrogenase (NADP+)